jgi:shikimate kinase/3-dehydroquinate synthase
MTTSNNPRLVFLIGFMAAGKTTVGRLAAKSLGVPFVDLDDVIESTTSTPVREIFATQGEAEFRRLEAQALADVIGGPPSVVATGGGAPCFGENLAAMRRAGLVVELSVPVDRIAERVSDTSSRPLLSKPIEEVQALYASRLPMYRQAHTSIRTDDLTAEQVCDSVVSLVRAADAISDESLPGATLVGLSDRAYPVLVTDDSLAALGDHARTALGDRCRKIGIISDDNVAPLYMARARNSLEASGFTVVEAVVPAGEQSKSIDVFSNLCEQMVDAGLDRSSAIVALGGGVVGDLAGYVASSLYRGVRVIQVPTTVLAMVDSAIGGKTGVNISAGKNLVGAFWQPSLVLADPVVLSTLPARERRAAYGELVKYGLLDGDDLYGAVEGIGDWVATDGQVAAPAAVTDVIRRCAAHKSWIICRDEREQTGERALLNLGHTVGHAIEAATNYRQFLHGEAVGLGLVAACRLSARLGICDQALEGRVADTLRRAGLDAGVDAWLRDDVLARVGVDKKRTGDNVRFVTLSDVGQAQLTEIEIDELVRFLRL